MGPLLGALFLCVFSSILAHFGLLRTEAGTVHYRMLCEVQICAGSRFITQDEALSILAEGPCDSQLYEVHNCIGATRYRIDFTRNGRLVARVQAKRMIDVMDAMVLALELRLRLLSAMKTVNQQWGFR